MAKIVASKGLTPTAKIAVAAEPRMAEEGRGFGGSALAASLKNIHAQALSSDKNNPPLLCPAASGAETGTAIYSDPCRFLIIYNL